RGRGRGDFRQQERGLDPEARPGARRRAAGAGRARPSGRGIRGQSGEEVGGGRGSRREGASADDGPPAAAGLPRRERRCRGCARGRDLPRASRADAACLAAGGSGGDSREDGAMIASLAGVVEQVTAESAVVEVNGVGYLVFASSRTLGALPPQGAPARLLIETHVREDHIHLYGFLDEGERGWFRLLMTVQGVGARLALAILS